MKKTRPVALLYAIFLAGPALAQTTATDKARVENASAISIRANMLLLEAEARALERCDSTRFVVQLPTYDWASLAETTIATTVSIEWSGACVDARRDGDGVLTWTEKTTRRKSMSEAVMTSETVVSHRAEGRFVRGQRIGLWCMTKTWALLSETRMAGVPASPPARAERHDSGCSVLAGHSKPLTDNYRKQSDGRWMTYLDGQPAGSTLAPGALEAHSAKVLADAAAGKSGQSQPELVVQNKSLDELVRGSRVVLAPSPMPIALKGKRVAIVLSSQTGDALSQFRHERQALIDASAGLRGEAAIARRQFIQVSDPDRLLTQVARVMLKHAKSVQPADDLVELQKGGFDYALILDWKQATRFDLLGKFDNFPSSLAGTGPDCVASDSLGAFLVGPDLRALLQLVPYRSCRYKNDIPGIASDQNYLQTLAWHFAVVFGKDADDIGWPVQRLDSLLEQK